MDSDRAGRREIDLRRTVPAPDDEVLELDLSAEPAPPPLRLFADLPGPHEVEYGGPSPDPTSLAGLWRAIESL